MPSEKHAARRGSVEDGMRMITACFARASQRCTSRTYMHFLLIFQEVRPISKTRNQLIIWNASFMPKAMQRKALEDVVNVLPQDASEARREMFFMVNMLLERKRQYFSKNTRLI